MNLSVQLPVEVTSFQLPACPERATKGTRVEGLPVRSGSRIPRHGSRYRFTRDINSPCSPPPTPSPDRAPPASAHRARHQVPGLPDWRERHGGGALPSESPSRCLPGTRIATAARPDKTSQPPHPPCRHGIARRFLPEFLETQTRSSRRSRLQ